MSSSKIEADDIHRGQCLESEEKNERPIKISWKDLKYTVKAKHSKQHMKEFGFTERNYEKILLKTQSGFVNSGEAMFIMGSSGAGKTTLLNAL